MTTFAAIAAECRRRKRAERAMYAGLILAAFALMATIWLSTAASFNPFAGRIVGAAVNDDGTVTLFRARWGRIVVDRAVVSDAD